MGFGPKSFFAAFNLYAWKYEEHLIRVDNLGPQYDCPTCSKERIQHYDPQNNCPKCPLTRSQRQTIEGLRNAKGSYLYRGLIGESAKRYGNGQDWPFKFSPEKIASAYLFVVKMLSDSDEKILPDWDETIAILARIVLTRRGQARYARLWRPADA